MATEQEAQFGTWMEQAAMFQDEEEKDPRTGKRRPKLPVIDHEPEPGCEVIPFGYGHSVLVAAFHAALIKEKLDRGWTITPNYAGPLFHIPGSHVATGKKEVPKVIMLSHWLHPGYDELDYRNHDKTDLRPSNMIGIGFKTVRFG